MSFEPNLKDIDEFIRNLERSGVLGRSVRRVRLLEHLLRAEILGQGDKLKAYSIGLDIFNKPDDFDPTTDSIVRVEIGRLRNALVIFEATEFADTRIRVSIPVGTYRPNIEERRLDDDRKPSSEPQKTAEQKIEPSNKTYQLVSVAMGALLLAFAALLLFWDYEVHEPSGLAIGVQIAKFEGPQERALQATSGLKKVLSPAGTIKLLSADGVQEIHEDANFLVTGQVVDFSEQLEVSIELLALDTNQIVWAKSQMVENAASFSESIEQSIGSELRVRLFGASKEALADFDPQVLDPEALFVLATWVPGVATNAIEWEQKRIEYARLALEKNPDFGAAHSVLADKLAYLANVYAPANSEENIKAAAWHAQRAVELAPLDPDVTFNVAQSYWHSGRISESLDSMKRVVELDPGHDLARFLAMVIPYTCSVAPNSIVKNAVSFDEALSADNPIRWLTLTWIGWLHAYREEWQQALAAEKRAALIFEIPYTFMRHAMVLNELNRPEDAKRIVERQSNNWSGFDPGHFATTTIPRLCSEQPDYEKFQLFYSDLAKVLAQSN